MTFLSKMKRVHRLTLILGMFSMSCLAMSLQPSCTAWTGISPSEYQSRSTQWAYAALGVAWVTRVVVTMPTDFPDEHKQQDAKVWPQALWFIITFADTNDARIHSSWNLNMKSILSSILNSFIYSIRGLQCSYGKWRAQTSVEGFQSWRFTSW